MKVVYCLSVNQKVSTDIHLQKEINTKLQSLVNIIRETLCKGKTNTLASVGRNVKVQTKLQLISNLKFNCPVQSQIFEIILTHAITAERLGPGSFDTTLTMVLDNIELILKGLKPINYPVISSVNATYSKKQDLDFFVLDPIKNIDSNIAAIFKEAIELAGFAGRIVVEKTSSVISSVELCHGYSFEVNPCWPATVRLDNPKIFVIDGFIENVSQVNSFLEEAASSKESAVLFLRGLASDVLETFRVNYNRGSLKIIPIIVPFDLEGINTVNDISIVCGCNMLSSNKGDMINAMKFSEGPNVNSVLLYPSKIIIQTTKNSSMIKAQIGAIKTKRKESTQVDTSSLYDKRIRSLSPNQVIIRLPDNKDFVRHAQAIDNSLRTFRALIEHGTVDNKLSISMMISNIYTNRCTEVIQKIGAVLTVAS